MNSYVAAANAMASNPDLHAKITSATTPAERATILREHGVEPPTHADVNSATDNLEGVSGAGNTTAQVAAAAPAAAPAAASAVAA